MAMSFTTSSKLSLRGGVTSKRMVAAKAISGISSQYTKSLPGIMAPFPDGFDPLNLSAVATVKDMKRWRESELHHGRIAMLAAVGYVIQEQVQGNEKWDWLGGRIQGPAIYHWQQTSSGWQQALLAAIAGLEIYRIAVGWATPRDGRTFNALKEEYEAGDLGFDPLNLAPKDTYAFKEMQDKELNNGRLAMIAVLAFTVQVKAFPDMRAAITVQELVYQKDLLTLPGFKQAWAAAPLDLSKMKRPPLPIEFPGKGSGGLPDIMSIKTMINQ